MKKLLTDLATPVACSLAQVVSEIDVLVALAVCVHTWDWCRPQLLPVGSQTIDIKVSYRTPCFARVAKTPQIYRRNLAFVGKRITQRFRGQRGSLRADTSTFPPTFEGRHRSAFAQGLRHPSVEAARGSSLFIPNDVKMTSNSRLAIVTGVVSLYGSLLVCQ